VNQIRNQLVTVSTKRKQDNKKQLLAYKKLLEYIKKRVRTEKISPSTLEIQVIEVFKKLTESGWIV